MNDVMAWVTKKIADKKVKRTTNTQQSKPVQQVSMTKTVYFNRTTLDGWIKIRLLKKVLQKDEWTDGVFICKYTKLTLLDVNDDYTRVIFKVEDGTFKGYKASMVIKGGIDSNFGTTPPLQSIVDLYVKYGKINQNWHSIAMNDDYKQYFATLNINGIQANITLSTAAAYNPNWDFTPIPPGTYEVACPDTTHDTRATAQYKVNGQPAHGHGVWFPILKGGKHYDDRYVHLGNVSHGCVTVVDIAKWTSIHDEMIKHRKKGSNGQDIVGILHVSK